MEAFTLTAPPRTDLRATLRELVFKDETKRSARTKSVTSVHPSFTRVHENTNQSRVTTNQNAARSRLGLKTRLERDTHLITGVAATALDAENRAALCVVNKNETKETPSSVTVSRKTPGSSTDINQSSPIRSGRTHQPHKRIGLLARRSFHSTSSSLKRRCVRTYHDVRDDGYDEKNTRRDGTKFNASIHPSTFASASRRSASSTRTSSVRQSRTRSSRVEPSPRVISRIMTRHKSIQKEGTPRPGDRSIVSRSVHRRTSRGVSRRRDRSFHGV